MADIKKPLKQQPVDKFVSPQMSSPATTFFMPPPNIPSAIPPKPKSQPMPQSNVLQNAGLQVLPDEPSKTEDDSSNFLASLIAQGAAGIGVGLMGGSPKDIMNSANVFDYMRKQQDSSKKAKLLTDPNSEESKKRRLVFKTTLGINIPENLSYTDLNDPTVLQSLRDKSAQSKLAAMPKGGIGVGGVAKPKKESLEKNPFNKEIVITSNMARSVDKDLKELLDIIERSGNSPISGADQLRQKQLVGKIAINYNKILDPGSIVKPEEAEAVVKTLGLDWLTRSNVSKESVSQFKNAVGSEAQNRLQGYYGMYSTFNEDEAKLIEKYKENPNDPKLIEAFSNIIKLKRMQGN